MAKTAICVRRIRRRRHGVRWPVSNWKSSKSDRDGRGLVATAHGDDDKVKKVNWGIVYRRDLIARDNLSFQKMPTWVSVILA